MPAPEVRELPEAPQVSDSPTEFNEKAFQLVGALADWTGDINALVEWLNANLSLTDLTVETDDSGFEISAQAPGAEGGPRRYVLRVARNPGTQFAPLVTVKSIGTDSDEEVYFDVELINKTDFDSKVVNLSNDPEKDFHSSITEADGIFIHSRLWVNTSSKIATLHFVIKGFATSSIESNIETISNNSDHGIDTFINTGGGLLSSSAKLVIPLYSNQGFSLGATPSIIGAIKIDSNANAWVNINSGADFSTGQAVTVTYKIK
jgi:hypothetical protein